ncbi:MAG: helix-turn-helix domain-containing protein [archaeon]
MHPEEVLQAFGLTEAEVKLYLELLKTGEATAADLAKRTATNRTFTYDRLRKLLDAGLAGYVIKDNRKYFNPAEPSQLLSILKEKEEQVKAVLPDLERLKSPVIHGPKVELYSAHRGIRTALNKALKGSDEVLIHGSLQRFIDTMGSYVEIWNKRRKQEGIAVRILTSENVEIPDAEISLLTEEESANTTTFSFGNTVIITLWSDIPMAIHIESEAIAKENTIFFNSIWDREIKIYSGVEGIRRAWMELVSVPSTELVGYGFSWDLAQIYGRKFSEVWHKERTKNGIPTRLIAYDDKNSKKYFDVRMIEWKDFRLRFLSKDYCGPACVTASDTLIAQFLYTEKKMRIILSKNKEMIAVHKKHFETLWKRSEKE